MRSPHRPGVVEGPKGNPTVSFDGAGGLHRPPSPSLGRPLTGAAKAGADFGESFIERLDAASLSVLKAARDRGIQGGQTLHDRAHILAGQPLCLAGTGTVVGS